MQKTQTEVSNKIPSAAVGNNGRVLVEKNKVQSPPPQKNLNKDETSQEVIEEVFDESQALRKGSFLSNLLVRAAILGLINLLFIGATVYLTRLLPAKAGEVMRLRSEQLAIGAKNAELIKSDIDENKNKSDKLIALFPDDSGLVSFANDLDKIKKEGKVAGFSFANNEAIKDKTGYLGIPVLIEFQGTWSEIDIDLQKIQAIPYLLRPIEIDVSPSETEGLIDFKFGGFLYVNESFRKN